MKKDIILAGVGGQGILTIATIIGDAAAVAGINLKQAEVHGMSQGGCCRLDYLDGADGGTPLLALSQQGGLGCDLIAATEEYSQLPRRRGYNGGVAGSAPHGSTRY